MSDYDVELPQPAPLHFGEWKNNSDEDALPASLHGIDFYLHLVDYSRLQVDFFCQHEYLLFLLGFCPC